MMNVISVMNGEHEQSMAKHLPGIKPGRREAGRGGRGGGKGEEGMMEEGGEEGREREARKKEAKEGRREGRGEVGKFKAIFLGNIHIRAFSVGHISIHIAV